MTVGYKDPLLHQQVCAIIQEMGSVSFDPAILAIFAGIHEKFARIYQQLADAAPNSEILQQDRR